jgi:hypothetical protein
MAQPEEGREEAPRDAPRLRLNMFPRPAKAKLISINMMSFFMVRLSYEERFSDPAEIVPNPVREPSIWPAWPGAHTGT